MQKSIFDILLHKTLLLLVVCFLNNNLCASSADQASRNYDQKKTEQMQKLLSSIDATHFYQPTTGQKVSHRLKKTLHIKEQTPADKIQRIQQLIEQGADPQQLHSLGRRPGLHTAVLLHNPRITELCLQRGCNPEPDLQYTCQSTPLLTLCEAPPKDLLEQSALLRFFGVDIAFKDYQNKTARDILLTKKPASVADFDATIAATDIVRNLKRQEINNARSPFLLTHLPVAVVVALVNEFSDDASWDKTCLPAIQEYVTRTTKKS